MMMTFGMALPPTKDCGAMMVDNRSDCGGSWDCNEARTTVIIVADSQSKDANPQGGNHRAMGVVNALNCGGGREIIGATMMATARKQTSQMEAVTTAIARCPSPERQKIAGLSRVLHNKSSNNSAEGEDCQQRHANIALLPLLLALLP